MFIIYQKNMVGEIKKKEPSAHLRAYLEGQNIDIDSPIDEEESGKGLSLNDLGKKQEEVKKEEEPVQNVNPAMASLLNSIDKVNNQEEVEPPKVVNPYSQTIRPVGNNINPNLGNNTDQVIGSIEKVGE